MKGLGQDLEPCDGALPGAPLLPHHMLPNVRGWARGHGRDMMGRRADVVLMLMPRQQPQLQPPGVGAWAHMAARPMAGDSSPSPACPVGFYPLDSHE